MGNHLKETTPSSLTVVGIHLQPPINVWWLQAIATPTIGDFDCTRASITPIGTEVDLKTGSWPSNYVSHRLQARTFSLLDSNSLENNCMVPLEDDNDDQLEFLRASRT